MIVAPLIEDNDHSSEELRRLYARCVSAWGIRDQEDMVQEECGELIVEINHLRRNRADPEDVLKEIADVVFMCDEAMYMYGFTRDQLKRALEYKIARTTDLVYRFEQSKRKTITVEK
jgi:NTP pyrophosphatase (non-canonical NTP hydrolase)